MSTDCLVLEGDCVASMRAHVPDESVQTCVTSPPYFGLRDYGVPGQIGLEATITEYVTKMIEVFREVRRTLRPDGTLWLNLGDTYAAARGGTCMPAETLAGGIGGKGDAVGDSDPKRGRVRDKQRQAHRDATAQGLKHKDLCGIPWRVAFALQADGWYLRQDIIWAKPNPMPESVRDRCTKSHEYIFLLTKSERYYFNTDAIKEPSVTGDKRKPYAPGQVDVRGNGHDRAGGSERSAPGAGESRNKRSVWTVTTKPFKGAHFATFPPDLIEPCVLAGAPFGGTVLDPFGGSGTTGVVALTHGRKAILCELNPAYAEMARKRIATSAQQMEWLAC